MDGMVKWFLEDPIDPEDLPEMGDSLDPECSDEGDYDSDD